MNKILLWCTLLALPLHIHAGRSPKEEIRLSSSNPIGHARLAALAEYHSAMETLMATCLTSDACPTEAFTQLERVLLSKLQENNNMLIDEAKQQQIQRQTPQHQAALDLTQIQKHKEALTRQLFGLLYAPGGIRPGAFARTQQENNEQARLLMQKILDTKTDDEFNAQVNEIFDEVGGIRFGMPAHLYECLQEIHELNKQLATAQKQ